MPHRRILRHLTNLERIIWPLLGALTLLSGCHRARKPPVSTIGMADAEHADQLISGFYPVERDKWRWTAQKFTVGLGPPPGSAQRGAKLVLELYIPDNQIEKLGPMTLRAEAAGRVLDPETFTKPGSYMYSRDLPASLVDTNLVPVNFSLDKAALPSTTDGRELGAVVTGVSLQTK